MMTDGDPEATVVFDPDAADTGKLLDADTLESVLAPTTAEEITIVESAAEDDK